MLETQTQGHGLIGFRQDPPAAGPANMAADLDLLSAGAPTLRLYEWDGVWVSLGRFQSPSRDLVSESVAHVVRPTGGKAVLHGHDWTVGYAAPYAYLSQDPEGIKRSVKRVYAEMVKPILTALGACGVSASLGSESGFDPRAPRLADCFAHIAANDIVDESGRKVCGCALRLDAEAALLQASIPKGAPLVAHSSVIVEGQDVDTLEWDWQRFPSALRAACNSVVTR